MLFFSTIQLTHIIEITQKQPYKMPFITESDSICNRLFYNVSK